MKYCEGEGKKTGEELFQISTVNSYSLIEDSTCLILNEIYIFFCHSLFLQLHLWHMEVPRLGVQLEL